MKRKRTLPLWLGISAKKYKTHKMYEEELNKTMNELSLSDQNVEKRLVETFHKLDMKTDHEETVKNKNKGTNLSYVDTEKKSSDEELQFLDHLENDTKLIFENEHSSDSEVDDSHILSHEACEQCLWYATNGICEPCSSKDYDILLEDHPCTYYMNRPCVECNCMLEELCNAYTYSNFKK